MSALLAVGAFANEPPSNPPTAAPQAAEGTAHVPAFDLPVSEYLSAESRAALQLDLREEAELAKHCPGGWMAAATTQQILQVRQCQGDYYFPPRIARERARYQVAIKPETIAGVATQVITPIEGVAASNRERVLINLHGGGFQFGMHWGGQLESIPIAAVAKIKVVSVDYRMAPENHFPAASEDVATVYQALLKTYRPQNIGIYGCSAGGLLTAQSVAWFQRHGLPAPGAIGLFCSGATDFHGDSVHLSAAIAGVPHSGLPPLQYLKGVDPHDPLAYPGVSEEVMGQFPPALLISATRDFALSASIVAHTQLVRLGRDAELHVWEGLGHGFFYEPDLPESREAYRVIANFFMSNLGRRRLSTAAAPIR